MELLAEIYKELKALRADVDLIKAAILDNSSTIPEKVQPSEPKAAIDFKPVSIKLADNSRWSHINIDGYPLTAEQSHILDLVKTGKNLKIEAFAGSGKTATLKAIASAFSSKKFLYLAFNKAIQLEGERTFPSNVLSKTAHSLAYRWLVSHWDSKDIVSEKLKKRFNGREFGTKYKVESPHKGVSPSQLIFLGNHALKNFCYSDSKELEPHHAATKELKSIATNLKIDDEALKEDALRIARTIWRDGTNPNHELPMNHDMYLKMWSLSKPSLSQTILFDEAQDANPVILSVVESQKKQKIYVGDRHQQIYSWRGAISAFDRVNTENTASLTECFRFGEVIATPANKLVSCLGEKKSLKGVSKFRGLLNVDYKLPYTKIFRTNAALLSEAINLSKHGSLGVVGGIESAIIEIENAYELYKGKTDKSGDYSVYKDWKTFVEASEFDNSIASIIKFITNNHKGLKTCLTRLKEKVSDEWHSDIILSTAHKAKGKEWDQVIVAEDFPIEKGKKKISMEEQRLAYVAMTRAKKSLEVPSNIAGYLN